MTARIAVAVEAGARRVFASAADWPGWSRSGKTEAAALEALAATAVRYAAAAATAGEPFPGRVEVGDLEVVERVPGDGGTDFGVPSRVTEHDRRPVSAAEADRLRRLVAAAWSVFAAVAVSAPNELRKGPRGGGRDRDRIVDHVLGADHAYCGVMGIRTARPTRDDPGSIDAMRCSSSSTSRALIFSSSLRSMLNSATRS